MEETAKNAKLQGWNTLEAKAILANMEAETNKAGQELNMVRFEFLKVLNRELDSKIDVSGDFKAVAKKTDATKSIVWAMELRPELKSEVYKAEMDAIAVNLALSRRSPTVYLGANYDFTGHTFPLKTTGWDASLAIQFPLSYDFWTQIRQKRAEQRQGELKRAELQDTVRLEVTQASANLEFRQAEVLNRQSAWTELQQQFDSMRKNTAASMEALRASDSAFEIHAKYLESIKEQLLALAELEWAIGRDLSSE